MTIRASIILPGLLLAATALADGVAVDPGQWEMKMTMEMKTSMDLPMVIPPRTMTTTECVEEDELGPDSFNMEEDSLCEFGDVAVEGNTVSWSISCPGPAGSMSGNWSFTSEGDTVEGQGTMAGNMGGQDMEFHMSWNGKRIGDCD